jgi:hypothetical protein
MDESGPVLLEIERLRGAVETGFARIDGRLDGTVQRATDTEKDVEKLDKRVTAVERRVWMAAGAAAVLAVGCSGGIIAFVVH